MCQHECWDKHVFKEAYSFAREPPESSFKLFWGMPNSLNWGGLSKLIVLQVVVWLTRTLTRASSFSSHLEYEHIHKKKWLHFNNRSWWRDTASWERGSIQRRWRRNWPPQFVFYSVADCIHMPLRHFSVEPFTSQRRAHDNHGDACTLTCRTFQHATLSLHLHAMWVTQSVMGHAAIKLLRCWNSSALLWLSVVDCQSFCASFMHTPDLLKTT